MRRALGIDVGGSGIKAAVVDLDRGEIVGERVRVDTPHPATPDAVVGATHELVAHLLTGDPVGIGLPGPVVDGVLTVATHIDSAWVGMLVEPLFTEALGCPVAVLNDADAAGIAEATYGAAMGISGTVLLLTLGTGIGSALLRDGVLVPNTEFGHVSVRGMDAEHLAAASVRSAEALSWKEWADRLSEVISVMDGLFWPDLVLLGGGVSREADQFIHLLDVRPPVCAAALRNRAGIVGAAAFADRQRVA
ncbi:MAG: ROK family protein [Thermoleophilia bacterium]|nr:ROK family protein [Thermoleophilia bacterium]